MTYTIDTPINQVRPDVTAQALSAALNTLSPATPLADIITCQAFVDAGKANNIDCLYLAAHAALESAWGRSNYAVQRHNLYGYQAYDSDPDKAGYFNSPVDCINFIAKFVATYYLSPNGQWYGGAPSLRGMNVHYATSKTWDVSIATIMTQIDSHLVGIQAATAPVYTSWSRNVAITAAVPMNVRAAATTQSGIIRVLQPGTVIAIDGYVSGQNVEGNSYWLKLQSQNAYIWAGGTNVAGIVGQVATPAPATVPPVTVTAADANVITQKIADLVADGQRKDRDIADLHKKVGEYEAKLQNVDATFIANQALEDKLAANQITIDNLRAEIAAGKAAIFKDWALLQIPTGIAGLAVVPSIIAKLTGSLKGQQAVIGWKIGSSLVNSDTLQSTNG